MDTFLEMHNLPRLNQEEIKNMNRLITSTEIEIVIKNLPANKSPGPDAFRGEFYQTFREENSYPSQTLPKYSRGRNTPKLILGGHLLCFSLLYLSTPDVIFCLDYSPVECELQKSSSEDD